MPIIGYRCLKCDLEFEAFYTLQSKVESEEPKEACPECKSTDKKRLPPTGTSFQLNGKGWARDNYGLKKK